MSEHSEIEIRRALPQDAQDIWRIIGPTIRAGETYALPQDLSEQAALAYWMAPDHDTWIAKVGGHILGTYYMRPNQRGGGAHVCNCGYMTAAEATGRGMARSMCVHSLEHARTKGYAGSYC